jgi:hypothetical protein
MVRSRIGPVRIRRTPARLREQLPAGRSLSGLRFAAETGRVVVADDRAKDALRHLRAYRELTRGGSS